jgi:hypothetical protein
MQRLALLGFRLALVALGSSASACSEPVNNAKAEPSAAAASEATPAAAPPARVEAGGKVTILVDGKGYHPAEIQAPANAKITLAFERPDIKNCGDELVIEALKIRKELPVGQTTEIAITTPATGELKFACGMDMYRGKVVVKP